VSHHASWQRALRAALGLLLLLPLCDTQAATGAPPKAAQSADKSENILVVRVTSDNKPVAGAQVAAILLDDFHTALTNADGLARVPLSPGGKVNGVVALHPAVGIGGQMFGPPDATKPTTANGVFQISLAPTRSHTVRVVDAKDRPIPNLKCGVTTVVWSTDDWIETHGLETAHFQTDNEGQATLAWTPRELRGVNAVPLDERWRADRCIATDGIITLKVRRLTLAHGHVRMPDGRSAKGLTITADGGGEKSGWLHEATAGAGRDGSYAIFLAPGDAYSLEVTDSKWASEAWTGIFPHATPPPPIELVAYPAIPLTVRVTRGPRHEPVADAWIWLQSVHSIPRQDAKGRSTPLQLGKHTVVYTDATGTAQFFVGKGEYQLFAARDPWRTSRKLSVTSPKPVLVEFNRPSTEPQTRPQELEP
jgi:hypothetical protein